MVPTIAATEPLDALRVGHTQWEARTRFPAAYWAFFTANGFGHPDPGAVRVPDHLLGPGDDPVLGVDAFTHPDPKSVFRTPPPGARVFATIGTCDDYPYLLELTTAGESPVYLWRFNDNESLASALADPREIGTVGSADRVADSFEQFLAAFTDETPTSMLDE